MPKLKLQASRKQTPAPDKLQYIIELVNSIPLGMSPDEIRKSAKELVALGATHGYAADFFDIIPCFHKKNTTIDELLELPIVEEELEMGWFIVIAKMMKQPGKDFVGEFEWKSFSTLWRHSIVEWKDVPKEKTFAAAFNRYGYLFKIRGILEDLAKASSSLERMKIPVPSPEFQEETSPISIRANHNGQIEFYTSPLVAMLQEALTNVEAKRIGHCPICERIFWRGRIDQKACTPKCANSLRNRKYRANYQEKYKQQRITRANFLESIAKAAQSIKSQPAKKKGK